MARDDPDFAIRDLYNSIAEGHFPSWSLYVFKTTECMSDFDCLRILKTQHKLQSDLAIR